MRIASAAILAAPILFPHAALAGAPGLTFSEPAVANFRTVITEVWSAPSIMYIGIAGHLQTTPIAGRVSSLTGPGQPAFRLDLGSSPSGRHLGAMIGARRSAMGFMFGAELFHNTAPNPAVTTARYTYGGGLLTPVQEATITQRTSVGAESGLRAIIGRDFEGMRLYGAIGLAGTSVTTSVSAHESDGTLIGDFAPHTRSMVGTHLALGMELQATESLSIRFEMSQTHYGSFSYNLDNNASGLNTAHRIGVSARRLTIGTVFDF